MKKAKYKTKHAMIASCGFPIFKRIKNGEINYQPDSSFTLVTGIIEDMIEPSKSPDEHKSFFAAASFGCQTFGVQ